MSNFADKTLKAAKATLMAGYAISLAIPYRVERQNDETVYHTPLFKLGYKNTTHETDNGEKKVHTYTITSFGLLNDQIATAKRLYMAAILKRPYYKEEAARKITHARDMVGYAVTYAKNGASHTINTATVKLKQAKDKVCGIEDTLVKFVEDIID